VVYAVLEKHPDWTIVTAMEGWEPSPVDNLATFEALCPLKDLREEVRSKSIRCDPKLHRTNGFFVARLEKRQRQCGP
jgi:16S rRNA C967 or C1407 C5-methylase (RsmB/RsmF family)